MKTQQRLIDRLLTALILGIVISAILINLPELKLTAYRMKTNIELTTKK